MNFQKLISKTRLKRIKEQGYEHCTDLHVSNLAFGNRFAYILCSLILIYGLINANINVLIAMSIIAFLGVVLSNHPFDYIYNYLLRKALNKPKLPPRSNQLKFACMIATVFLVVTVYFFYNTFMLAGYITGTMLILSATLVSTTDICLPSIFYNKFLRKE